MNNPIRLSTLLILVAICGAIYLLVFGFFKSERPLYFGIATHEMPKPEKINQLTDQIKLKPQILVFPIHWPAKNEISMADFPTAAIKSLWDEGVVPCLTWMPSSMEKGEEKTISFDQIKQGSYDDYLKKFTDGINTLDFPLIIRFAPDMNMQAHHWGVDPKNFGASSAELYKTIYQYVVNFFRQQNVHNVLWAFSPSTDSVPKEDWNKASSYYPGSDYVDILGMGGYNAGRNAQGQAVWRGFMLSLNLSTVILSPLPRQNQLLFLRQLLWNKVMTVMPGLLKLWKLANHGAFQLLSGPMPKKSGTLKTWMRK